MPSVGVCRLYLYVCCFCADCGVTSDGSAVLPSIGKAGVQSSGFEVGSSDVLSKLGEC